MKLQLLIQVLLLLPILSFSQTQKLASSNFNKKYFECEDKWVVLSKDEEDSTYSYDFVYWDQEAGFTFNMESKFMINDSGKLIGFPRDSSTNIKLRLEESKALFGIIPDNKVTELNLPKVPEWLHFYKEAENTTKYLVRKGYHYNHLGASNLAIPPLEKAYQLDKNAKGLEFELAYAYNATDQFKKAIVVLKKAIKNNPKNYFFYRELGFAQIGVNQIKEAEKTYMKGIKISKDKYQKSEMCINMTQAYFSLNKKKKFKKWAVLTKKYAAKDSKFLEYIRHWEGKLK